MYTLDAVAKNSENYRLAYCPVGNSPAEPAVIFVGKTPGLKTLGEFMLHLRSNRSLEEAAFRSVYSKMKPALFRMLSTRTRFFVFMELVAPLYWKGGDKWKKWNDIFDDYESSLVCGIQLTQSCNCCIHTADSKEPTDEAMREIGEKNPGCLFSSFLKSDKLELIIFLDTPSSDGRYHPERQFLETQAAKELIMRNVRISSFPHPSSGSPATYDNIWGDTKRLMKDYRNVYRAAERTMKIIEDLIASHTNNDKEV